MILHAASAAFSRLLTPSFRQVLWKSLGLTIASLVGVWFALRGLFEWLATPWISQYTLGLPEWTGAFGVFSSIVAGLALSLALGLLIAPVTALVAGFFLDDVAEVIETEDYPDHPKGRALPLSEAIIHALKFFGVVVAGNLFALLLLLVPGINVMAFFLVNGYLLGREYFEFAAMRFRTAQEARALRRQHKFTVLMSGFLIAVMLSVPILNLLTPLFAAAMMVHVHKALGQKLEIPH